MWNVSIRDGKYWQSCHDPDCRMGSFRGNAKALPTQVISDINDILLEKDIAADVEFEKALLEVDVDIMSSKDSTTDRPNTSKHDDDKDEKNEKGQNYFHDKNFGSALSLALSQNPQIFP